MMQWPTYDDVIALYVSSVHAGPLLDRGKLEGAVLAPFSGFGDVEFYPTLNEKAARLIFEVCQAHAFADGNKRLAWLCGVVFYEVHNVALVVDQTEAADIILGVAAGDLTYEQLLDWLIHCPKVNIPA